MLAGGKAGPWPCEPAPSLLAYGNAVVVESVLHRNTARCTARLSVFVLPCGAFPRPFADLSRSYLKLTEEDPLSLCRSLFTAKCRVTLRSLPTHDYPPC